jgi:predicted transposase YdaD
MTLDGTIGGMLRYEENEIFFQMGEEKGRIKGRIEGRMLGMIQGRLEGIAQNRQQTAIKMKEHGLQTELIAEITNMDIKRVKRL